MNTRTRLIIASGLACLLVAGSGPASGQTVYREFYAELTGTTVADLLAAPSFPNNPSSHSWESLFEAPSNVADQYGTRMRGFVIPPVSGSYLFWIASDDASELSLSTSASPAGKSVICSVHTATGPRQWNVLPEQQSAAILLLAGQRYYIEALHKEGAGADFLAVGWQLPGGTLERPIPGSRLAPFVQPETTFIASGAAWRYLANGSDQGSAWRNAAFNDSVWLAGASPLGYGESGLATTINGAQGVSITSYFRRTFVANNAGGFRLMSVRLRRDDGAVVYLNGTEVFRNNMPLGPINYQTLAPLVAPDDGQAWLTNTIPAHLLLNGVNIVAVEVHQQLLASPDMTFDLALVGDPEDPGPPGAPPTITPPPNTSIIQNTSTGPLDFTVSDTDTPPGALAISALSDNQNLVPNASIVLGGSGLNRTVSVTPNQNVSGTARITLTVSDGLLSASGSFNLVVSQPNSSPSIQQQPVSQKVAAGGTATFNVSAIGSSPLSYQWFFNGVPAQNGTQASLTIANVQNAQAGPYYVRVTNSFGSATSVVATLTVTNTSSSLDFGDAPDSVATAGYPTLLVHDGARHFADPSIMLGSALDVELDGQPNADATGDDIALSDDEDGIVFLTNPLIPGNSADIQVTATVSPGITASLDAWIDYNLDRAWNTSGVERILTNVPVSSGTVVFTVTVPAGASNGLAFARFRIHRIGSQNIAPAGPAPLGSGEEGSLGAGEVEDYPIAIQRQQGFDLLIAKTDSPDPVAVGQTLTYTMTASNAGPDKATNVMVVDTLPQDVVILSAEFGGAGCLIEGNRVTCSLGDLNAHASGPVTIRTFPTAAGHLTNCVSIQGTGTELDSANNQTCATTTVTNAPQRTIPCDQTNKGTDFWLAFPGNYAPDPSNLPHPTLCIVGRAGITGTVSMPNGLFLQNFIMPASRRVHVQLPGEADLGRLSDAIAPRGIHVVADDEVCVFAMNRVQYTSEAYLGFPSIVFGTTYIVQAWGNVQSTLSELQGSEFAVVACESNTLVTITPSYSTGNLVAGQSYERLLHTGEVYQLLNTNNPPSDLSGTLITSTKPIGVFAGHRCANIPNDHVFACDHVVEQLVPASQAGRQYITTPLKTRVAGDTFRVFAVQNNTQVTIGSTNVTLNRGQFNETILTGPTLIQGNKPIHVAQFGHSSDYDNVTYSDPLMIVLPDTKRFHTNHTICVPDQGFPSNFVNVVVPTGEFAASFKVNGNPVVPAPVAEAALGGYQVYRFSVAQGVNALTCNRSFGAIVYGFNAFEAYGMSGGFFFGDVQPPTFSCSITQQTISVTAGTCTANVPNYLELPKNIQDNCSSANELTNSQEPAAGTSLPPGVYPVEVRVTDAVGNVGVCVAVLTIVDPNPPSIDCPANRSVNTTNAAGAVVTFRPGVSDDCDPNPVVTCNPRSGSSFPVGTTTVQCTATDSSGHVSSCGFQVSVSLTALLDFGDAQGPGYPTLLSSNGARHYFIPGWHLGSSVDAEPDGQPSANATGDDANGSDDEDGVSFLAPLLAGSNVTVQVISSTNGLLAAWIDFNRDGTWQSAEQIFTNTAVVRGTNLLVFTVPPGVPSAGATQARFRLSNQLGLGPGGLAQVGEVEDYAVELQLRFSDQNAGSAGNATVTVQNNTLFVTGIAVSGSDGVQINVASTQTIVWQGSFNSVVLNQSNTVFSIAVFGDLGTLSNVFLASVTFSNTPSGLFLFSDFSTLGPASNVIAEISTGSTLAGTLDKAAAGLRLTAPAEISLNRAAFTLGTEPTFVLGFDQALLTSRDASGGASFTGDTIALKLVSGSPAGAFPWTPFSPAADSPAVSTRAISRILITTARLPSFAISKLESSRPNPRLRIVRLANGHYSLSWLQVPLSFQLQSASALSNLPGSWQVVTPDSTALIQGHVILQITPAGNTRFFRLTTPPRP